MGSTGRSSPTSAAPPTRSASSSSGAASRGPARGRPWLDAGLRRLLPPLARLASRAPARVLASLANALHQIGTTPGARVDAWVDALEALGPACPDADVLLRLGQVLAWRAGLAHYRSGALAVARALPEELARRALELPAGADVREAIERLDSDPWFAPGAPAGLRSVARVGAFRGFGGRSSCRLSCARRTSCSSCAAATSAGR
jgi:hypothetical protein